MVDEKFTPEAIEKANAEVERLQHELDITNADHIALWLEANMADASLAWMACRIVEAHEASNRRLVEALDDYNGVLRSASRIAQRDGAGTNWPTFRERVKSVLHKHHETWLATLAPDNGKPADRGEG